MLAYVLLSIYLILWFVVLGTSFFFNWKYVKKAFHVLDKYIYGSYQYAKFYFINTKDKRLGKPYY